jgi:hypothetical protein|tara:strand:- start:247 stop:414 length:168 start_codon:yes stop_codon:yes gene_type:complete
MNNSNKKIWYVRSDDREHTTCGLTLDMAAQIADFLIKSGYKNVQVYVGQSSLGVT